MSLKSAKGHAKNARNKLRALKRVTRKDDKEVTEQSIQYALDELLASIEEIEKEIE